MYACPKCQANMRTVNRNGIHLEQCEACRGIFLDHGELETIARLESQWAAGPPQGPPPAAYVPPPMTYGAAPAWGGHHGHYKRKQSLAHFLFSS